MNALNNRIMSLFQQFGISPQESKAYLSLLEKDNVTGYALSKNSGIHSSKIYAILNKLLEREFIIAADTRPVKYFPRKPEEVMSHIRKDFEGSLNTLSSDMDRVYHNSKNKELITWNITGRANVFRKVRDLITMAESNIFIATWFKELRSIRLALSKAVKRGVKLKTVVHGTTNFNIGTIYQHKPSDYPLRERSQRRFIFTSDNNKAVIANFEDNGDGSGLWTENEGLVMLFRDFIIHEIYIIKIQTALPRQIRRIFGEDWEKIRE